LLEISEEIRALHHGSTPLTGASPIDSTVV